MKNKKGDKIFSAYWFIILFAVAAAVVYMVSIFYGMPYDARNFEAEILTNQIADCLSQGGYLKGNSFLGSDSLSMFLEECDLTFDVEDTYGWEEQGQYYVEVHLYDFDENASTGIGEEVSNFIVGNSNLKTSFMMEIAAQEKGNKELVVIHYTAGYTLAGAINEFDGNEHKSIHYIIDRDGTVVTRKDEDKTAYHAGCEFGRPYCEEGNDVTPAPGEDCCRRGTNSRSIGIELINLGYACGWENNKELCQNLGVVELDYFFLEATSDKEGFCGVSTGIWEEYSDEQIDALSTLVAGVVSQNNIPIDREHIVGHDEMDPCRKKDPGPAFPWEVFMGKVKERAKLDSSVGRNFYVLDRAGNQYVVQILTIVDKVEKNAK